MNYRILSLNIDKIWRFRNFIFIILLFILVGQAEDVLATGQILEKLKLCGNEFGFSPFPLGEVLGDRKLRPFPSSACWRGYYGIWIIKNNRLYLESLHECQTRLHIPLKEVKRTWKAPVFAKWYTGSIFFYMGEELGYDHYNYRNIREKSVDMKFEDGVLISAEIKSRVLVSKGNIIGIDGDIYSINEKRKMHKNALALDLKKFCRGTKNKRVFWGGIKDERAYLIECIDECPSNIWEEKKELEDRKQNVMEWLCRKLKINKSEKNNRNK